ncbi:PucR family transcriptional regulator [Nocardia aurea]|uniref:Helix-turn-helix domain-containing protein n=1 Tax=Nocardia aurea TaxID=2144174 RepID=A0ABV3FXS0_9NOCA
MVSVDRTIVQSWLADFAERMRGQDETERVLLSVDRAMVEEFPQFFGDAELHGEVRTSARAHWLGLMSTIGRTTLDIRPPLEAVDGARTVAKRGYELNVLLKTYRVGQRGLWRHVNVLLAEQIRDPELRGAVLVTFWERCSRWLDNCLDSLILSYFEERERRAAGIEARRTATVQALLRGEATDEDLVSHRLGHNIDEFQTALSLWAERSYPASTATRVLARLATDTAAALGAPAPLTLISGSHGLWAWIATEQPCEVGAVPAPPVPGTHLAVGTPWPGPEGFRRSHREALAAQRIATSHATVAALTTYRDVDLVSMLTGDGSIDGARVLIEREIGAIAGRSDNASRLRDTVREYLANGGNVAVTAEQLGVHTNTVRYRIQQAEHRLGHSLEARRLHVELALRCLAAYGDQLLPPSI